MTSEESKPNTRINLFVVYFKTLPIIHDVEEKELKVSKFQFVKDMKESGRGLF
jgi:hypothetical protein